MKNNQDFQTSCIRFGDEHKYPTCQSDRLVKYGKTGNGKQRYLCKNCRKRFIKNYTYRAYQADTNSRIVQLTKEGLGIRSTARVPVISATTLLKRILQIASGIKRPAISIGKTYEVIFIGRKTRLRWIAYALDSVINCFFLGARLSRLAGELSSSEDLPPNTLRATTLFRRLTTLFRRLTTQHPKSYHPFP